MKKYLYFLLLLVAVVFTSCYTPNTNKVIHYSTGVDSIQEVLYNNEPADSVIASLTIEALLDGKHSDEELAHYIVAYEDRGRRYEGFSEGIADELSKKLRDNDSLFIAIDNVMNAMELSPLKKDTLWKRIASDIIWNHFADYDILPDSLCLHQDYKYLYEKDAIFVDISAYEAY